MGGLSHHINVLACQARNTCSEDLCRLIFIPDHSCRLSVNYSWIMYMYCRSVKDVGRRLPPTASSESVDCFDTSHLPIVYYDLLTHITCRCIQPRRNSPSLHGHTNHGIAIFQHGNQHHFASNVVSMSRLAASSVWVANWALWVISSCMRELVSCRASNFSWRRFPRADR